jgi:exosome complex RNA-binding protein Csl4
MNNALFAVKGLKYEKEVPGLGTPKEAKGKYKSSGYGNLNENQKYTVTRKGGSVGEKPFSKEFPSKEEADAYAKRMNKGLSSGEKSYYKIKYVVKQEKINEEYDQYEFGPGDGLMYNHMSLQHKPMQHKPKEDFKVGDIVKYKGLNHKITRILDDGRIYIKNMKYSGRPDTWVKAQDLKKSKTLKESQSESGLNVIPKNPKDLLKLSKALENSDFYGELIDNEYYFFPEEEENYDQLELDLDEFLRRHNINYTIEGVWNESLNENTARTETFQDAVEYAKRISKEEGVAQHIEETPQGDYKIVDWYDADKTIMSFEAFKWISIAIIVVMALSILVSSYSPV